MEIRKWRCCLCPQSKEQKEKRLCPENSICKKPITACEFVLLFLDEKGAKYRVFQNKNGLYQGFSQHEGQYTWIPVSELTEEEYFDNAQTKLNILAEEQGWRVCLPDGSFDNISNIIL